MNFNAINELEGEIAKREMLFSLLQSRMWKIGGQNLLFQFLNFSTIAADRVRKDYECNIWWLYRLHVIIVAAVYILLFFVTMTDYRHAEGVAPTWLFFAVVMLFLAAIDALTYDGVNEFFSAACDRPQLKNSK